MSTEQSVDLLAQGLLSQFTSLKELEAMLTELIRKQEELLGSDLIESQDFQSSEEAKEVSLMVSIRSV